MLEELIGQVVVLDLRSPFVCLGRLERVGEHYLEMRSRRPTRLARHTDQS